MSNQKKENQGNERKRDAGSYRHKTRKLSIRAKVIVPTAVMVAVICCCMALLFKSRMETDMISTGGEMAVYIGNLAENALNGSLLDRKSVV